MQWNLFKFIPLQFFYADSSLDSSVCACVFEWQRHSFDITKFENQFFYVHIERVLVCIGACIIKPLRQLKTGKHCASEPHFFWSKAEIFHKNSLISHEIFTILTHLFITNCLDNGILNDKATKENNNKQKEVIINLAPLLLSLFFWKVSRKLIIYLWVLF